MTTPDKRANPRFAVEVDAELKAGSDVIPIRTRDVSSGGLCFQSDHALPLGREVQLRMALVFDEETFSEPLSVRARVVWCTALGPSRYQVGTTFFGLTSENRAYLDMFLRYLKDGVTPGGPRRGADEE